MPLEESEFMKASDLIRVINSINSELERIFEKDIHAIIQNAIKDPKCIREVNSKKDLNGLDTVGFYMIFNNDTNVLSRCKCKIRYKKKTYGCVYRGHAYHIKDRLLSHLFYTPKSPYKSCMLVENSGQNYNINIDTKKCFQNGILKKNLQAPQCEWIVIKITLSKSKQATREMFENAFDNKYGKPIYSHK